MRVSYSFLALTYRQWHYRTTPEQLEQPGGPATAFTALQGMNIISVLMLVPPNVIPGWLFVSTPFVVGALVHVHVSNIYRANPMPSRYAALNDPVPRGRDFPMIYAYLFVRWRCLWAVSPGLCVAPAYLIRRPRLLGACRSNAQQRPLLADSGRPAGTSPSWQC